MSQALRRLRTPLETFRFRQPFQDLFFAILEVYTRQKKNDFRKTNFSCFRGCRMDRNEFLALRANKGGYIQLEGFTSTSLSSIQASSFITDTWIEIKVNIDNLGGEMDWGFAYVEEMSSQPHEKEIIFNPINIFKVIECKEKGIAKLPVRGASIEVEQYIELEYAPLTDMMKRQRSGLQLAEIEKNIIINY